jgi:glycosyltransferase involved in cell wall biosynthesis
MVVAEEVSKDRRAIGWGAANFSGVNIVMNPNKHQINVLLAEGPHTVHVFGAAISYPWGRYALYRAAQMRCRMGLMMEAAAPDGWKAPFRWVKYSLLRALFGKQLHFVLAMGTLGVRWFKKCGFPTEKIFPFAYIVENPDNFISTPLSIELKRHFHILFVGQLISRKRVDLLLKAIACIRKDNLRLSIIGDGPERERLKKLAVHLDVNHLISWLGALPNVKVRTLMTTADLLILPSRFDGWGAVVNEALMAGMPVICTDHCGAADLLQERWRGEVVPRDNLSGLISAIIRRLEEGPLQQKRREKISNWAACITGRSAAAYLNAVFAHVYQGKARPAPPWYAIKENIS